MGKGIRFRPEEYYEASHERLRAGIALHQNSEYSSSIYLFGVAIECILRAYITADSKEFDEKHVLPRLFTSSGIENLVDDKIRQKMAAAMGNVWARWKNDFRYASRRKIEGIYRKSNLPKPKGDFLKENSRIILDAASLIVTKGIEKWPKRN
ncbi:MAG TPA: hypothetical protein VJ385_03885 [Fibrobacteria bacterium]|nr:hypothetical protein [Fibrobacteria bacterium]